MKAQKETLVFFHAGNGRSRKEENEGLSDRQKQIREGAARSLPKTESTPSGASPSSDRLKGITSHRRERTKRRQYEHVIPQIVSVEEDPHRRPAHDF